ncbi:TauD/TfdA family dioxygenase [Phenylobacterium sp. LjRoot225]|uniref:TauD/TfdA dioxygenase family protein n=1 Tax=Phenylobacterium sp. LjRoot225 TaxID=3342285 RepID=UPI003ECEEB87
MALTTIDLCPRIGAEIRAEPAELLAGTYAAELRERLEQRGVLVFRELGFDDDQQMQFSATLGDILPTVGESVFKITFEKGVASTADYTRGSFVWHIDRTNEDVPTRASILSARRLSQTGGETEFANTYAAWDDLPESEKTSLEGLRVVHSVENGMRLVNATPSEEQVQSWRRSAPRVHPLVWTHRSGRKSLVLGSTAASVEGMGLKEGRALLDELLAWATQPRFVYRHAWKIGDLLIWDNTGTMHRVQPYGEDSGRLMHRTSLVGEEAVA